MCVCTCVYAHACMHVFLQHQCGSQRTTLWSQFLPFNTWVPDGPQQQLEFRNEHPRAEARPQLTVLWFQILVQNPRKFKTTCKSRQRGQRKPATDTRRLGTEKGKKNLEEHVLEPCQGSGSKTIIGMEHPSKAWGVGLETEGLIR